MAVCIEIKGLIRLSAPILEATFFATACMCSVQDRFSSMFSPRALLWSVWFILTPSTLTLIVLSFKECNFWRELMTINSVFATLRLNLLALSQRLSAFQFSVDLGLKTKHVRCSKGNIRVISVHPRLKQFGGPIIDPWRTPQFKGLALERWFFTLHRCRRFVR